MTGTEVEALRKSASMDMDDFAQFCGVSARTVARWEERGKKEVPLTEMARRVLVALGAHKPTSRKALALLVRDRGWCTAWAKLFGQVSP